MSTILCIDTASDVFALAVDRGGVLSSMDAEAGQNHSRLLLPAISRLLQGEKPDAILVVIGPGAYAGVRVGIATAEGLSVALGISIYGIGTLEAAACAGPGGEFVMIHPAGRGDFAAQRFVAGSAVEGLRIASRESLDGLATIGEGAGELGGIEVSSRMRCEAALKSRATKIRTGDLAPGAEAFYLREPNVTLSRRTNAAAS